MLDFDVVMRVFFWRSLVVVVLLLWASTALAQRCNAYVSVDGTLLDGATACYFSAPKGADNAYIRTDRLTAALKLESDYLPDSGTLRFKKGKRTVDLATTTDMAAALSEQAGALSVGGTAQAGHSAILAPDGYSYVPLGDVVAAFGGTVNWNQAASLASVDFSAVDFGSAPAQPNRTAAAPATPAPKPRAQLTKLSAPRYARHENYTRVAVDIPAGVPYELAVDGNNFIALFGAARAKPYSVTPDGPQLSSLGYATTGDTLALIASTSYPLSASGQGFEVGHLAGENGSQTLYIDFAPGRQGEKVARLPDLSQELATVRRPTGVRKTVVIDPGHGGHDPGASSQYVTEKDLVLKVGLRLRKLLEARGINVEMTRDGDTFVELEDRARFAVPSKHNLFISLHANATETAGAQGIETWVFGEPQDDSLIDLAILENGGGTLGRARTVQARDAAASIDGDLLREENLAYSTVLATIAQKDLVAFTGSENRGTKNNYFVVLREARVPAVLVELGFVNSPVEGPKLATASYQQLLAKALADAIETFLAPGGTLAALEAHKN